ncbi:type II toxin-antitoxin system PemK/MazF family toxin [Luethyella okanaganae]|uniref:Type II toxin-antitoxin system PemK/MazF family toxin n=1 Tax=Luethyella okanaganae TaxID=69372 RepID=A0ABW1VBF2_9MICO
MSRTSAFLGALTRLLLRSDDRASMDVTVRRVVDPDAAEIESPGRFGASATVEVDPRRVGSVRMSYSPVVDGDPDPGEIVWTWVPFEERDGRGKDRPVVIVAAEGGGTVLAAQLTSKERTGRSGFVSLGRGVWDAEGRPSWVNLDRIFRVHPDGMRREAASLDAERFLLVAQALRNRYNWR